MTDIEFHLSFAQFGQAYAALPKEDFLSRFSEPILLVDFEGVRDVPSNIEGTTPPPLEGALTQFTPGHDEKLDTVAVVPVVKSDRNTMANVVTLGRANSNDIVLPHGVISKLHAVFKKDPTTGQFSVTDAQSKYGTAVDGYPLPPAEAYPLTSKSTIVFAKFVQAVVFSPRDFHQHMHLMLHLGRDK